MALSHDWLTCIVSSVAVYQSRGLWGFDIDVQLSSFVASCPVIRLLQSLLNTELDVTADHH